MAQLLLSAAHKSSGKTTLTLGLCAALTRQGLTVQPFKKGPDYIDPMWLGRACGRPCYNLDFNTQGEAEIVAGYVRHAASADLALIEGNMGLYDSVDPTGAGSNAALARLLNAPVILALDASGMNRTIAAIVLGLQQFDPALKIGGVILNKVAGRRHESKLRTAIEHYTDIPLLGVVHRDPGLNIEERHLGLVPSNEAGAVEAKLRALGERIGEQVDLQALLSAAAALPATEARPLPASAAPDVRLGIARDEAFGFYYPDDLEQLQAAGAELVPFDTLNDTALPEVDALFIGGGFPEARLQALEANRTMREAIRDAIEAGIPAYAECGGLMYLCRTIAWEGRKAEMVGVIPADVTMHRRPVGRGYTRLKETAAAPWPGGATGAVFNAHEFHYSGLENVPPDLTYAYEVVRGTGIDGTHDGIVYKNLLANYAHLRDAEAHHWARRFIAFVRDCRAQSAGNKTTA